MDKFAPKLTAAQRSQIEAVARELMEASKDLIFSGKPSDSQEFLKEELPWIEYLLHAADDGRKGTTVRSPSKRITSAKKIKRDLKLTPTIAKFQTAYSLTAQLDDKTIAILDKDLSNCCSGISPELWEEYNKIVSTTRRKTTNLRK